MKVDLGTGDVEMTWLESAGFRLQAGMDALPQIIGEVTQVVADNPKEFGLIVAGSVVGARIMTNLVRPRTLFQAVCTAAITEVLLIAALGEAKKRGLITLRFRGPDGKLYDPGMPRGDSAV